MRWLDVITDSTDVSLSKLRVGDRQGGLECCSPGGRKESDTTKRLKLTELKKEPSKFTLFFHLLPKYYLCVYNHPGLITQWLNKHGLCLVEDNFH